MMAKPFHYSHLCAPSSEARGRRPDHDKGCGWMCVRSTKESILDGYKAQGSPCPMCRKRTRLNPGNVREWYSREDAVLHASEYNRENNADRYHSADEQTGEQTDEQSAEPHPFHPQYSADQYVETRVGSREWYTAVGDSSIPWGFPHGGEEE